MSYFDGIRKGDHIWTIQEGWTEVLFINRNPNDLRPIATKRHIYALDGKFYNTDFHQSAFWSDPGIVTPPRPKRMKKVKVEVRPYKLSDIGALCLITRPSANGTLSDGSEWLGPVQTIDIEVEDND